MSPALKNGLLLAALVLILILAGWFFTRGDKEATLPKTGYETEWMCDKCGKQFSLSPAQFDEWFKSPDKIRRDPNMGKQIVFWCPDCQAFSVVRAEIDPKTKKWYITLDSQGMPRELPPEVQAGAEEPPPDEGQ